MLSDPKYAGLLASGTAVETSSDISFNIAQGDPSRVTRIASTNLGVSDAKPPVLTVARSVSSENKGQLTDRVAIRIQQSKPVTIADADAVSTAQATLTMSIPRYGFGAGDVGKLVQALISYLSVKDGDMTVLLVDLPRVLAGEA